MDVSCGPKPFVSFAFEVEKITDITDDGRYQVQWAPVWVSKMQLVGCENLIQEFLQMKSEKKNKGNLPRTSSDESDTYYLQEPEQFIPHEKETIIEDRSVDPIVKNPQEHMIQVKDEPTENGEGGSKTSIEMEKTVDQLLASWADGSKLVGFGNCSLESQGLQSETHKDADWHHNEQGTDDSTGPMNHISNSQSDTKSQISRVDIHLQDLLIDDRYDRYTGISDSSVTSIKRERVLEDQIAELPVEHSLIDAPTMECISDSIELGSAKVTTIRDLKKGQKDRKERSSSSTKKPKKFFKCPQCEKSFSRKGNLKQHLHVHAGIKPFSCEVCEKAFTEKVNLKRHQLLHSRERPHQCNECDRSFREKGHLVVHARRAHTGVKPFQCNMCEMKFVTNTDLKQHSLRHT